MAKNMPRVGVIAEDDCDVDSIRALIHRIAGNQRIGIKKFVGKGCGKVRRKCHAWADDLRQRGCSILVLIHDLDDNNIVDLKREIQHALSPCPITTHLICIPIQEFEAWLLSDPNAIQSAMHLRKIPKIKASPETINSPKEYLGELIYRLSNKEKIYINTKHNEQIAAEVSIDKARSRCPSFIPFYDFIQSNFNS